MNSDSKSREEQFMKALERKELTCSHVFNAAKKGISNFKVYPLCVQTFEDGYELFWYCDECIDAHGLSPKGTYVVDVEDEIEIYLEKLGDFIYAKNEDQNPFFLFLDQECKYVLERKFLEKLNVNFDIDAPLENGELEQIPYGLARRLDK